MGDYKEYIVKEIYGILEGLPSEEFIKAIKLWEMDFEQDLFDKIMKQIEATEDPDIVIQYLEDLREM